jgi:hypothetical protein
LWTFAAAQIGGVTRGAIRLIRSPTCRHLILCIGSRGALLSGENPEAAGGSGEGEGASNFHRPLEAEG